MMNNEDVEEHYQSVINPDWRFFLYKTVSWEILVQERRKSDCSSHIDNLIQASLQRISGFKGCNSRKAETLYFMLAYSLLQNAEAKQTVQNHIAKVLDKQNRDA